MPKQRKFEYLKKIDERIEMNGCHVTYVFENKNRTPFGYSTGLFKKFDIPEIFISGLPHGLTHEIINNYSKLYRSSKYELHQLLYDLTDRFPVYFMKLENEKLNNHVLNSIRYYGNDPYSYVQLIYPDLHGHFPGSEFYSYDQDILGDIVDMKSP